MAVPGFERAAATPRWLLKRAATDQCRPERALTANPLEARRARRAPDGSKARELAPAERGKEAGRHGRARDGGRRSAASQARWGLEPHGIDRMKREVLSAGFVGVSWLGNGAERVPCLVYP